MRRHLPTIEYLGPDPVCFWPMFLGPWKDDDGGCVRVVVWLWFYITFWVTYAKS